jgi:1-acyl-sn-glycerol-3-phosphate acyltransferase
VTATGGLCRNRAKDNGFCAAHQPPATPERIGPFDAERVHELLRYLKRRATGDYEVDEFGFDAELTERVLMPMVRPMWRRWWRVDWLGLSNVRSKGAAMLVPNHAGTVPVDALVLKSGLLHAHPAHRHVRLLAGDLAFRLPVVAPLARKMGGTLACDEDATRLLEAGELLAVFPEGYKGVGKGWRNRYRLQRFGRGGFVELALRTRTPIVPVAIVGSEEIYPMIANAKRVARLAGLPYFPVTPFFPWLGPLGMVPLPSKWIVEFGKPIPTGRYPEDAWQDAMLVFDLTDRVRDIIQQMLYRNLMKRRGVFF